MRKILLAMGAIAALSATPILSHDGMHSNSMMSNADMKQMNMCMAMPHAKMLKSTACNNMMKMHPDMMKMSAADMKAMRLCMAMSRDKMMKSFKCSKMMKMHSGMMKSGM